MHTARPWLIKAWEYQIQYYAGDAEQIPLDFDGIAFPGQSQTIGKPADVGVHHDAGGFAESRSHHHVGRLAGDAPRISNRASKDRGTSPPCRSTSNRAVATRDLAF